MGCLVDRADQIQTFVKLKVLNNAIHNPPGTNAATSWQSFEQDTAALKPKINTVLTGMSYQHICQITCEVTYPLAWMQQSTKHQQSYCPG